MSGHTPGPWVKDGCVVLSNDEDRGMRFAIAERVRGRNHDDQEANARLIAAAPELLEAVKTMAAYYNDEINLNGTAIKFMLDKAISKAEAKP